MTPPSPAREGAPPPPRGNRCRSPSRQTATSRSSRPTADSSWARGSSAPRSEEHTSELQSRLHLACRLPPEKKTVYLPSAMTSTTYAYIVSEGHERATSPLLFRV